MHRRPAEDDMTWYVFQINPHLHSSVQSEQKHAYLMQTYTLIIVFIMLTGCVWTQPEHVWTCKGNMKQCTVSTRRWALIVALKPLLCSHDLAKINFIIPVGWLLKCTFAASCPYGFLWWTAAGIIWGGHHPTQCSEVTGYNKQLSANQWWQTKWTCMNKKYWLALAHSQMSAEMPARRNLDQSEMRICSQSYCAKCNHFHHSVSKHL